MKKLRIWGAILAICAILIPQVVDASTFSVPDVSNVITSVDVYRHYLQLNDMLVVVNYDVRYSTSLTPSDTIDKTFIGRYMNGAVELSNVAPNPFINGGYKQGVYAFYFNAASAPAWLGAYRAETMGSPLINWLSLTATTAMSSYQTYYGGAFIADPTAFANSAAANDMNLFDPVPGTVVVNDASYYGSATQFNRLALNLGTSGDWAGSMIWEYFSSTGAWIALAGVVDGTVAYTSAPGLHDVTFSLPSDWATTSVNAVGPYYYIRSRISTLTAVTTSPLGTQSWTNSSTIPPLATFVPPTYYPTSSIPATALVLRTAVIGWANALTPLWGTNLTMQAGSQLVLTTNGETYFSSVIPALRTAVPSLFAAGQTIIAPNQHVTTTPVPAAVYSFWPWSGTVGGAGPLMKGFFFFLIGGSLIFFVMKMSGRVDVGILVFGMVWLPIGVRIGLMTLGVGFVVGFLCLLVLLFTVVLNRGAA